MVLRDRQATEHALRCVLVTRSIAVGEAIACGLLLRVRGRSRLDDGAHMLSLSPSGHQGRRPRLAILVETPAEALPRVVRHVRADLANVKVLAIGIENREQAIVACFAAGADGVVLADEPLAHVRDAAAEVLRYGFRPPPPANR